MGHCVTKGDVCYILAKATLCQSFLSIPSNEDYVKQNNASFRKERRKKSQKSRTNHSVRGIINRMSNAGGISKEIDPIVNLARAFDDNDYYDSEDGDEASYE